MEVISISVPERFRSVRNHYPQSGRNPAVPLLSPSIPTQGDSSPSPPLRYRKENKPTSENRALRTENAESDGSETRNRKRRSSQKIRFYDNLLHLERTTSDEVARNAIFQFYPEAAENQTIFRYIIYAAYGALYDRDEGERLFSQGVLEWIAGRRFRGAVWGDKSKALWGKDVIAALDCTRCAFPSMSVGPWIPDKRARLLLNDGVAPELMAILRADLSTPVEEFTRRVYIMDGTGYESKYTSELRKKTRDELERMREFAPSETALYIWERMNDRPSNRFARVTKYAKEALAAVDTMEISVERIGWHSDVEYERMIENIREYYKEVIRAIQDQPQPFYKFSENSRTDRIFSFNKSLLNLPADIRDIFTREWTKLDLKGAHLGIGAALWDVPDVSEYLRDPNVNVWGEYMNYFGNGCLTKRDPLYAEIKEALKPAQYSVIYGMYESNVKGQFTKDIKHVLGPDAGRQLGEHWIIRSLLDARDLALRDMEQVGYAHTATGIRAEIDATKSVDARSVMATVAQSYEQAVMRVILEYEEEHLHTSALEGKKPDFQVMLWLHDGVYVHFTRGKKRHIAEMQERVRERAQELLGEPLYLEVD